MQKGKIVFLNGVSSSGKTTLSKKLQDRLNEPYYSLSLDTFINMSPTRYFTDPNGRAIINKSVSILPHTIQTFSNKGLNTIIDHVLLKPDNLLDECVELLHEYPVLFVHVTYPLEELRRREKERGNPPGVSESQLRYFYPQDAYDIVIDTTNEECIEQIIELLDYPEKSTAFKILWSQRAE